MKRFFSFRMMVSSIIIKILYVLGVISIISYSVYQILEGSILIGISSLLIGNLAWRLICEGAIAIFSIHDVLVSIERKMYEEKQQYSNHNSRDMFK
ncbi:MAG: DUF4282 domain-containing protein [Melioribacteraceae bacterium]|nr:DUF4282 domain-containing protein [Melioribacteraceae bacterium]